MAIAAIHPGEHLAEELEELGLSAAELARKMDVPTNRVTQILNGTRAITGARSFGSIYRVFMTCGAPRRKPGNPFKDSRG